MRKDAYRRSYCLAFNQYLVNKEINIDEFEKLENPPHSIFNLMNLDNSINIKSINNSKIGHIGHKFKKEVNDV